jgi:hypothetical protein
MGERGTYIGICSANLKEVNHLEDLGLDKMVFIVNIILKKYKRRLETGCI